MKKILTSSLMMLLAMSSSLLAQTATAPSFGDGSSGSPYQISTLNHLYWITQNSSEWDKYYIQTANIDAFSTSSWDSNEGFSPIGNSTTNFTGTYDGDGYTINGLTIARSTTQRIGLFGKINGAAIQDLGVTNVNISGFHYVGALVGRNNSSTISNCYSTGSVTGTGSYIGGLAGLAQDNSTISNCYSTGTVTGNNYVVGLAGYIFDATASVINCYSTGTVTGNNSYVGGFVGRVRFNPTVSNSFWDTQTSGQGSSADGTGKTTAEMKTASTFYAASWDFEEDGNDNDNGTNGGASGNGTNNYWDMDQGGNNYPVLSWQDGATVLVTDLTDPSAPTALIATPGNTQVVLTWAANSEGDLASYKVYRGTSASPTTLSSSITAGTETSTEESLTNGTLYYFNISALDNVGNESSVTSDVSSLSHNPSGDYSLSFDGVSDYVNVNAVANEMSSVTDWAVSFWVNPNLNSFPEAEGDAVGVNTSSGGNIVLVGMKKIGGFPTIYDGASSDTEIVGSTGVSSSSWNHIVYSRSGSTGSLYLNGVSQGTHIPNYTFSSSDKWTLGGEYDNTTITNEYAGFLDEVAVWNDDLTAEEITALYNSGMPLDASSNSGNYTSSGNVQGYWRFAENSGTTTYDLSGDGNHGTISGATYSSPGADAFAPTMTITAAEGADGFTSNDSTLALTFTSSEATSNFAVGDITVTNGSLSSFAATSSTVYTATFTPAADGAVTIDVGAGGFTDSYILSNIYISIGNNNTAATQFNWVYDGTAPAMIGIIVDGTSADIDWTNSTSNLTATWSGFSDTLSGIQKYEYAIGSSSGGTDVVDWTNNTTDTSVTKAGLTLSNGTTYYLSVRAADNVGNVSTIVTSDGITIDTDVPTISSVVEGSTTEDIDYQNSDTTLIIVWTGSDTASGIAQYEYALGTAAAASNTVAWTNAGTSTADTLTGLSLTEDSTYYLSARATDVAENLSVVASGDGITIDMTAPAGTIVNDGTEDDIVYTGSDSTLSAVWPAFTETVSGISNYEYAIGSSSGGTDVVDWTNTTTDTSVTKAGLTLSNGTVYYISVRAADNVGNVSTIVTSDGVIVDTDGPIAGTVLDGPGADIDWTNSTSILTATWIGFSDTLSGIQKYEYAIGTEIDSFSLVNWTSVGLDTFFIDSNLTLISGETYYVVVKSTDHVGNTSNISSGDGITVDLIVPLIGELYDGSESEDMDWQSSDSTFSLYWSGSDSRELDDYQYSVGTAPGDSNIAAWTSVSTNTSMVIENVELVEEQTYYGSVRAEDRAGNISDVVSSDGITIDYSTPVSGSVSDGLSADLIFTGTADSLSANWTGFSDSISGISNYEYAIGTTNQGTDVVSWVSTGTDSSMTHSGLTLANGSSYFISVRATDFAGNFSDTSSSDGIIVDIEVPMAGSVFDGSGQDEELVYSFTTLESNWSGFSDTVSGIQHYEYAIGTEIDSFSLVNWTSVGLDTFFIDSSLTLISGETYYVSVRATDLVENTSAVTTSNGITVQPFIPTNTEPFDGSISEDLDWQQDSTTLFSSWQSDDNYEIAYYEYSFGTAVGDSNIVTWTENGTNTDVTISSLSLKNGTTYFVNIRAYEIDGNQSTMVTSDGLTIDFTPPEIGIVYDGIGTDINLSNHAATASANWTEFVDSISGIELYEYVLGSTSGSSDIIDWTDNGTSRSIIGHSGLNLQHTNWYYFSVRATDLAGNVSAVSTSDGFVIDIYPGPPTFVSMTFDTASELLSLTNDRVVDIVLSEPSVSMEYEMTSNFPVTHTSSLNNDSIQINLNAPFTSLDTLIFSISNLTDMIGLDSSYSFTIYTKLIADYNDDGLIDVNDLNAFSTAWNADDISMELGPVTGLIPHLIPTLDNAYDLRDIMILARMWHWSNNTPSLMLANINQYGPQLDIQQSGKILDITLTEDVVSGQVLVLFDQTKLEIENTIDQLNQNEITLKSHFKAAGNLLIEKAYLTKKQEKSISLEMNSLDKKDSYISIQFIFLDQYNNTVTQGFVSKKVIAVPKEFALQNNYPNPFNPATTIQYDIPIDVEVLLVVYDILGRHVKTLINTTQTAGYKSIKWNGTNDQGQMISAGVYFYHLQTNGYSKVRKMLLLK